MPIKLSARRAALLVVGLLALGGCRADRPKGPRLQDALPYLPLPPNPEFVSRSNGEDALQIVLTTTYPLDSTIALYRAILSQAPWNLSGDQPAADGGRTLLATREGHPLWIMISANPAGPGTRVSLNGAVLAKPDSSARKATSGPRPDTATSTRKPARPAKANR